MSVISNFPAMPNRINIATEYLYGLGEKGDEWSNIEGQLSPLTQGQVDDGPEEKSGKSMAEDVLREMDKLGMLAYPTPETIALHSDLATAVTRDRDLARTVHAFLFAVLTDPVRARQAGQEEVVDALAWLLAQDSLASLQWKGGSHVERISRQLETEDELRKVIGNDQRFQNLVYWARYLGLAERVAHRSASNTVESVIPDPTEAIAHRLPAVFQNDHELTIQMFVQRLAAEIGVLDGGSARRNLEIRLRTEYQSVDKRLSRSLSLALSRLKLRRQLKLESPSDASVWLLDFGRNLEPVSHVVYIAKELS